MNEKRAYELRHADWASDFQAGEGTGYLERCTQDRAVIEAARWAMQNTSHTDIGSQYRCCSDLCVPCKLEEALRAFDEWQKKENG